MALILKSFPRLAESRLLSLSEFADLQGRTRDAIARRMARGARMPVLTRVSGRPMFVPHDVVEWLVAGRNG